MRPRRLSIDEDVNRREPKPRYLALEYLAFMSTWDQVYDQRLMTLWEPHETVVQFVGRFLKRRIGYDRYHEHRAVRRILDLGCGNGAQSVFLAHSGFDVYGVDVSPAATKIAEAYAAAARNPFSFPPEAATTWPSTTPTSTPLSPMAFSTMFRCPPRSPRCAKFTA